MLYSFEDKQSSSKHRKVYMGHLCRFCGRSFSRRYNRDLHEKQGCHKRLEEETIESFPNSFGQEKPTQLHGDSLSQDEYDDDVYENVDKGETEVEEDFSDKDNQSMTSSVVDETEAEETDVSDEDDKTVISTVEDNDTDPWEKLREESVSDLNTTWEEQVEQYTMQGLLKNDAEHRASSLLLPAYRKRLRVLYLDNLKWHQALKTDPVHKQVMKTLRRFMDDEEMDYAEAAEAAINKRKYLLNRVMKYEDISEETSSDNENEEWSHTTARKRKYHEI